MGIKIDLSQEDVNQSDRTPLPEGDYEVEIVKCEIGHPKSGNNTDKYQYSMQLKVISGEHIGRSLFQNVSLWYEARYTLIDLMKALGYEIKPGTLEAPEERELIGKRITVRVKHESYKDEPRARVSRILTDSGSTPAAAPAKTKVGLGGRKLGS